MDRGGGRRVQHLPSTSAGGADVPARSGGPRTAPDDALAGVREEGGTRVSDPDVAAANIVRIFDTTLRDGEQAPGIALTRPEKVEIAEQLARLSVDIIEAGFPISSVGEFDAGRQIADEGHGPVIAALARTATRDVQRARQG